MLKTNGKTMSRFIDIQTAFDTKLDELSGLFTIAWPNTAYEPVIGETYLEPFILPAASARMTLAGKQENPGIYQINVYVEAEKGSKEALDIADFLYDHFANLDLSKNDTCISVNQIEISQAQRIDSWHVLSVSIYYTSYSN